MTAIPKPRPNRDELRLEHCRSLPCLVFDWGMTVGAVEHMTNCESNHIAQYRCDPHHVRTGANSGIGTKPGHDRVIPLCRHAHDEHDRIGAKSFEAKYGLDLVAHAKRIAKEFERLYPNRPKREPKPRRLVVKSRRCWAYVRGGLIIGVELMAKKKPDIELIETDLVRVEIRAL